MYHPYSRGKQYELITIRETASLLKKAGFHPIIEPVRETLGGLQKALNAVLDVGGDATLIVNPFHGDLSGAQKALTQFLKDAFSSEDGVSAGLLLKSDMSSVDAIKCYEVHEKHNPVFIHAGFTDAKALAKALGKQTKRNRHVFLDAFCGKLYRKHFLGAHSVIVRDGFKKQRNADYEPKEQRMHRGDGVSRRARVRAYQALRVATDTIIFDGRGCQLGVTVLISPAVHV